MKCWDCKVRKEAMKHFRKDIRVQSADGSIDLLTLNGLVDKWFSE